jgi:hypothetical protein
MAKLRNFKDGLEHALVGTNDSEGIAMLTSYHIGRAMESGRDFSRAIITNILDGPNNAVLRFEGLACADLKKAIFRVDTRAIRKFVEKLFTTLPEVLDRPTPTLSLKRSKWQEVWTDGLQALYEASGLRELNRMMGYDK